MILDLSYNKLHEVSALTSIIGEIDYINLKHNRLIDVSALQQLNLERPTTLDITENPLECSCTNACSLLWADKQRHMIRRERCWEQPPSPCTDAESSWTFQRVLQKLADSDTNSNATLIGDTSDSDYFDDDQK